MNANIQKHKVTAEHLEKDAMIYLRISDPQSVRNNPENVERHRSLQQLPINYGWSPSRLVLIEHDLGRSGRFVEGRAGFTWMCKRVVGKGVGALFCMEAARLARCNLDFAELVKYCRYTNTLIIDPKGVYDLKDPNDRLNLGFQGLAGEVEVATIRERSLAQRIFLAKEGKLRLQLPTGFIYSPAKKVILDPDESIRKLINLFFAMFEELASLHAVVRYFREQKISFPTRLIGGPKHGEVVWGPLTESRAQLIIKNPRYAGIFAYGRRETVTEAEAGEKPSLNTHKVPVRREDWKVNIEGAHDGYITPDRYLKNLEIVESNQTYRPKERKGVHPFGSALLQGIAVCGNCGQKMRVDYPKAYGTARYLCVDEDGHRRKVASGCHRFHAFPRAGVAVDDVVQRALLEAINPAQIALSIASLEQFEKQELNLHCIWDTRIRAAEAGASKKRKAFDAVNPENRYVKADLERELNEALAEVERLRLGREEVATSKLRELTSEQKQAILSLARDFPHLWNAETTTQDERKSLLRKLIEEVRLSKVDGSVHITICWTTKAITPITINLCDLEKPNYRKTDSAIIEKIRELAPDHTDSEVAKLLNTAGLVSKRGRPFTRRIVAKLRREYGVAMGCTERLRDTSEAALNKPRGDGRVPLTIAAKKLNVSCALASEWCRKGILDAIRVNPKSSWWVLLTPEHVERLRKPDGYYHRPRPRSEGSKT
jgi:DNA invertase Pin-like site-specific DNA recombinase